jgi:hypothetical protein
VDRCRLRSPHDVEGATVCCVSQPRQRTSRLPYPALSASPTIGDGCAGPRSPSMRLFHASQARPSASLRTAAARHSAARTPLPKRLSRDFMLMGRMHSAEDHRQAVTRCELRRMIRSRSSAWFSKGNYASPVHLIGLTETQEIAPYRWVHPDEEATRRAENHCSGRSLVSIRRFVISIALL